MRVLQVVVVCALVCACALARESKVVRISQGSVRGYKPENEDYYAFFGIPYATAPTGSDRFKAPLAGPLWMTTLEAVDNTVICPQATFEQYRKMFDEKNVQENCLIANVYVPDTEETNLPVVVMVHGGAYQIGFGSMTTPKGLLQTKKIIVVSFNYRLGIHGFLCLGTKDAPGNAGMKDQVALLRWVNKNIASFGGNPDDVTILGFSAGSSAVDLLMISKMTKGLFKKVIPESGANVGFWSAQIDPINFAKDYAITRLNFTDTNNVYDLERVYKQASLESLTLDTFFDRINFPFTPCVERDTGVERFLDKAPVDILKEGKYPKVPVLYGFANMEGLFRMGAFETWKDNMNNKFSDFLPQDLQFANDDEKEQVAQRVKSFYFGDKSVSNETVVSYVDFFTDTTFAYPHLRATKLHAEAGNNQVYLYEFSFVDEAVLTASGITDPRLFGANHCAQTFMIQDSGFIQLPEISESLLKMRKLTTDIWFSFIIKGKPVVPIPSVGEWEGADATRSPHLSLGKTVELRGALLPERAALWDDIYERHYRKPTAPPAPPHSEL